MVEKNSAILLVALGVIVVISLFSTNLAGNTPKELRGVNSCKNIGYGSVEYKVGGDVRYLLSRCTGVSYTREDEASSIYGYYCGSDGKTYSGGERPCPIGTNCKTKKLGKYGTAAYCG